MLGSFQQAGFWNTGHGSALPLLLVPSSRSDRAGWVRAPPLSPAVLMWPLGHNGWSCSLLGVACHSQQRRAPAQSLSWGPCCLGYGGGESLCSPSPAWKHREAPLSFLRYCPQAASSQDEGDGHCPAPPRRRGSGSPWKELRALVILGL